MGVYHISYSASYVFHLYIYTSIFYRLGTECFNVCRVFATFIGEILKYCLWLGGWIFFLRIIYWPSVAILLTWPLMSILAHYLKIKIFMFLQVIVYEQNVLSMLAFCCPMGHISIFLSLLLLFSFIWFFLRDHQSFNIFLYFFHFYISLIRF